MPKKKNLNCETNTCVNCILDIPKVDNYADKLVMHNFLYSLLVMLF